MGGRVIYASSPVYVEQEGFCSESSVASILSRGLALPWTWLSSFAMSKSKEDGYSSSSSGNNSQNGLRAKGPEPPGVRYIYDTCVAVDCTTWLDAMASCTKAKFPDADIRVTHSPSSLTGFCVVLRLPPPIIDGYEFITLSSDETESCREDNDSPHASRGILSSISLLNQWQHRSSRRLSLAARRCISFACRYPLLLYLQMYRSKGHIAGIIVLYAILHGTYFLVKRMHPGILSTGSQASGSAKGEL